MFFLVDWRFSLHLPFMVYTDITSTNNVSMEYLFLTNISKKICGKKKTCQKAGICGGEWRRRSSSAWFKYRQNLKKKIYGSSFFNKFWLLDALEALEMFGSQRSEKKKANLYVHFQLYSNTNAKYKILTPQQVRILASLLDISSLIQRVISKLE